jgi:hypothetical protein
MRRHPGTSVARGLLSRIAFETVETPKKWHICHLDESS